jgi:hypothetical protein
MSQNRKTQDQQDQMNYQGNSDTSLKWIQNWYLSQCNGDWEHQHGVKISTLDNPGWDLKVDITNTNFEGLKLDYKLVEITDSDWYGYKADGYTFEAFGDPTKLETLIAKFREFVEANSLNDK